MERTNQPWQCHLTACNQKVTLFALRLRPVREKKKAKCAPSPPPQPNFPIRGTRQPGGLLRTQKAVAPVYKLRPCLPPFLPILALPSLSPPYLPPQVATTFLFLFFLFLSAYLGGPTSYLPHLTCTPAKCLECQLFYQSFYSRVRPAEHTVHH